MPPRTATPRLGPLSPLDLTRPETADLLVQAASAVRLDRARAEAQRYPTRVLANALVNVAWRKKSTTDPGPRRPADSPTRPDFTPPPRRQLGQTAGVAPAAGQHLRVSL